MYSKAKGKGEGWPFPLSGLAGGVVGSDYSGRLRIWAVAHIVKPVFHTGFRPLTGVPLGKPSLVPCLPCKLDGNWGFAPGRTGGYALACAHLRTPVRFAYAIASTLECGLSSGSVASTPPAWNTVPFQPCIGRPSQATTLALRPLAVSVPAGASLHPSSLSRSADEVRATLGIALG